MIYVDGRKAEYNYYKKKKGQRPGTVQLISLQKIPGQGDNN